LLGGRIGVDEAPGGGALFWVEFEAPLVPVWTELSSDQLVTSIEPAGPSDNRGALRVLAAEDHPANRLVLEALLEPAGVSISFAENGREAVTAAGAFAFDLILMDVNMPVMDGVSALHAIRALGGAAARTPVHMVTANVFEEDVQRYLAAGADGVLKKPIDARQLLALVMSVQTSGRAAPPGQREDMVDRLIHDAA
jgi:CheY-like chemotaxis protein